MKSTKLKFLSLAALVFAGVFGGAMGTAAWFTTNVRMNEADMLLTGDALGAYFEYGDGTSESPYGIKTVRQLYNLAWLQYLGYFNATSVEGYPYSGRWVEAMKRLKGDDTFNERPHFELAGDIDWGHLDASSIGITGIPPIGTTTFPFDGAFDGRGYTITDGVFSTNSSDFGIKPLAVTTYTADTNVGVFGKVTGASTSIKDVGISSPLVKSTLANTVIGAAIGDAGTAQYSNIAVDDPTLRIGNGTSASNLSDYGLVGKIDASQAHRVQIVDNKLSTIDVSQDTFTVPNQGGENDWGGSINMTAMFNRLNDVYANYASVPAGTNADPSIPLRKTYRYNYSGTKTSETVTYTATYGGDTGSQGDSTARLKRYNNLGRAAGKTYNEKLGHFQLTRRYDPSQYDSSYIYLSGGYWSVKQNEYEHAGYKITDGTNYLQLNTSNSNNIGNQTSATNATLWEMPTAGQSGTIKTTYNGTTYYLYDDNGTLKAGNTQNTWFVMESNNKRYIYNDNRQLIYSSGWKVTERPLVLSTTKSGNTYYLSSSGSAYSTVSDPWSSVNWFYDGSNFYYNNGSSKYYLKGDGEVGTKSLLNNKLFEFDGSTKYLYFSYTDWFSTKYEYLVLNNSNQFTYKNNISSHTPPSNAAAIDMTKWWFSSSGSNFTCTSRITNYSGPDYSTTSKMRYDNSDVTFFPLGAKESANDPNATHDEGLYEALYQNTGYVIGGSSFDDSTTSFNPRTDSTIRVSKYYASGKYDDQTPKTTYTEYLKNFDGESLTNVRTLDANNAIQTINDGSNSYEKYKKSKEDFVNILRNSGGSLYGLHFMQSDINEDYLASAPYVRINGQTYSNYQMPASSIDFRLKQKGYVNFFAGSYMSSTSGDDKVDSFFSLHLINRDPENVSTIQSIEEIEEIYSDYDENDLKTSSHSYIYRVKDKENSTPSTTVWKYTRPYRLNARGERQEIEKDQQGQDVPYLGGYLTQTEFNVLLDGTQTENPYYSVFNTSRIKTQNAIKNNQSLCYYFEIPVNEGEYCLGSVSDGKIGGYLLYLDIGANAQKDNRTQIHEKFVRITSLTAYIENFVLVESASTVMAALITTDGSGNRVQTGEDLNAADSIAFRVKAGQAGDVVIERDSNVITLSRSGPPDTEITYAARGMTLREQTGESAYSPISLVTDSTTTTTFNRLTLLDWDASNSVATVTTITDETGQSRVIAQTKGGETVATPVIFKGTDYGAACGTAFTAQELADLDITYSPASTIMEFDYIADAATTIATDFALQSDLDDETGFFTLDGYDFDITRTGSANFTAYVTKTTATITVVIDEQNVQYTFTYKINGTSVTAPTSVLINRAPAN